MKMIATSSTKTKATTALAVLRSYMALDQDPRSVASAARVCFRPSVMRPVTRIHTQAILLTAVASKHIRRIHDPQKQCETEKN